MIIVVVFSCPGGARAPEETSESEEALETNRGGGGAGPYTGEPGPACLQASVLHYHWSRSNMGWLSLVETFIVLLVPEILCHKEPARRIQRPNGSLLAPRWFFMA